MVAYCGLYCGDCAGYAAEIADAAEVLLRSVRKYGFTRTALHLFPEDLPDMEGFVKKLAFMTGLRCSAVCRLKKDDETKCKIRACCREKGYYACHECDIFEQCGTLAGMKDLHGDSCIKNLQGIRSMGLEQWIQEGTRHWFDDDT